MRRRSFRREKLNQRRKGSSHARVQQAFVPLTHISGDVVVCRTSDGRAQDYQAILEVSATNFALKSEEEQALLITGYRHLLRALRFPMQLVVVAARMDLSAYIASLSQAAHNPLWQPYVEGHQRSLAQLGAARTLVDRRFYLVIGARENQSASWREVLPLLGKRWRSRRRRTNLWLARQILKARVQVIDDHLAGMGLSSSRLHGVALAQIHARSLRGEQARAHTLPADLLARLEPPFEGMSQMDEEQEETGHEEHDLPEQDALSWEALAHQENGDINLLLQEERELLDAPADLPPPSGLQLADVLAPESIVIEPDAMRVGTEYVRGIALVSYPREVTDGWLVPLFQLDEVFDLSIHLVPQPSQEVVRRLMLRRAQYASTQRINQRQGRQEDPYLQVAETDVEELIGKIASGQECVLEVSCYLLLRARDRKLLEEQTSRVLGVLESLLVVAHPTTLEHDLAYRSIQPLCQDQLVRSTTLTSTVASTAFPFVRASLFMSGGTFVGVTPSGEPIFINPWDLPNPHEFYGGISGAGKSYAVKLRLMHELWHQPELQVIVIDPGGEYTPLVKALGGTVIRLAPGSGQCINPCEVLPQGVSPRHYLQQEGNRLAEKKIQLFGFLSMLLDSSLSSAEKAVVDRALSAIFQQAGITDDVWTHFYPAPLLSDLVAVLEQDAPGLADRLRRFISGSFAGIFERPTNVELGGRLLCFDIRGMNTAEELRPLAMYVIAEFVWTQALYNRRPRRLYIDEAWSLIEHEAGARFLEKLAREARKYFLSLVVITQNPEQFIQTQRGSVIAQNAMTKVLKRLDSVGSKAAREAFGLTSEEERLLLSLPQEHALLMVADQRMIGEIRATPEEHRIITTKPSETSLQTPPLQEQKSTRLYEEAASQHVEQAVPLMQQEARGTKSKKHGKKMGTSPHNEGGFLL